MDAATVGVLTGGIGVAGTLLGVVLTQWRSDLREQNRLAVEERREQQRMAQESERERDARLFDHRRSAYLAVIEQYQRWIDLVVDVREGLEPEPPEDAMKGFWRVVGDVDLYGSSTAANKAQAVYFELQKQLRGHRNSNIEDDDLTIEADERYADFVNAARADLGLPERWPPPPIIQIDGRPIE